MASSRCWAIVSIYIYIYIFKPRLSCNVLTQRVVGILKSGLEATWSLVCLMMMESAGDEARVPRYTKFAVPPDRRLREEHAKGVCESFWAIWSRT